MNLIIISPHGRSGSLLMHSLFDQHPEVASLPIFFEYPDWEYHDSTQFCLDKFIKDNYSIFNIAQGYLGAVGINTTSLLGLDGKENIIVSRDKFLENANNLLKNYLNTGINRKIFVEFIHLAYYQTLGFNIDQVKYILIHIHDYTKEEHFKALSDYKSLKYLAMTRDPREDWISEKKVFEVRNPSLINIFFKFRLYNHSMNYRSHINYLNNFCNIVNKDQVQIIDLNKFHSLNKEGMKALCSWIGIDFIDSLLLSTFIGKTWHGNAANRDSITGFNAEKAIFKWPKLLSSYEENFISSILKEEISYLGYKKINSNTSKFNQIEYLPSFLGIVNFHFLYYISKIKNTLKAKTFYNKYIVKLPFFLAKFLLLVIRVIEIYKMIINIYKDSNKVKSGEVLKSNLKKRINAYFL